MRSTTGEVLSTWPETFLGNITEFCPEVNGRRYKDYAVKFLEKNVLPLMGEFDGLFLRKGKIMFWVSKKDRRMITCIKAKVPVGKITAKLQRVTGPGNDFWVRH